jgi:PiT family inorganic phosphate transporter
MLVAGCLLVIFAALCFEFINGFHDSANAIATVVSTKVLTPREAIFLAACFNLFGALYGVAVATTIGKGLVDTQFVSLTTIFCALIGAIVWNLITWWFGLPSSSSHALIGGLCGAALATTHNNWAAIKWFTVNPGTGKAEGIIPKVVIPMFVSPLLGLAIGFILMAILLVVLQKLTPHRINSIFGRLQLVSASYMGFSHGTNDAQKTMGVIALSLYTATKAGAFDNLPSVFSFLVSPEFHISTWIKVLCALTMASGTAAGGWRIIRTMGHKMVRIQPIHGFAAETSAATVIQIASHLGFPISTTHVISSAIMGVGATKRLSAVKWGIVERMLWAWVMTLPAAGLIAYCTLLILRLTGFCS